MMVIVIRLIGPHLGQREVKRRCQNISSRRPGGDAHSCTSNTRARYGLLHRETLRPGLHSV